MADKVQVNKIPNLFQSVYTGAPQQAFWDALNNPNVTFEDALRKTSDQQWSAMSQSLIAADLELEGDEDDDIQKALEQLSRAREDPTIDIDMMDTSLGLGLSEQEIFDLLQEYPALPYLIADLEDPYADLDRAERIAINENMTMLDEVMLAEPYMPGLVDRLSQAWEWTGDKVEDLGGWISNVFSGLGPDIRDPESEEGLQRESENIDAAIAEVINRSPDPSMRETFATFNRLFDEEKSAAGVVDSLEASSATAEEIRDWMATPELRERVKRSGLFGDVEQFRQAVETSIRRNPEKYRAFGELYGGQAVTTEGPSAVDTTEEPSATTEGEGAPVSLSQRGVTASTFATTPEEYQTEMERDAIPYGGQAMFPGEGPMETVTTKGALGAALETVKTEGEATGKVKNYQENLDAVFWNEIYSREGGGRSDLQGELARLGPQTIMFFFLQQGLDAWNDISVITKGELVTTDPATGRVAQRAATPRERQQAVNQLETNYSRFLKSYLNNPAEFRSGEVLQGYLDKLNRILSWTEQTPSLKDWNTVYTERSSEEIEQDKRDAIWITGLFGGDSVQSKARRKSLAALSITNGGMGYYSRQIHNAVYDLMDHYERIGLSSMEAFRSVTGMAGKQLARGIAGTGTKASDTGRPVVPDPVSGAGTIVEKQLPATVAKAGGQGGTGSTNTTEIQKKALTQAGSAAQPSVAAVVQGTMPMYGEDLFDAGTGAIDWTADPGIGAGRDPLGMQTSRMGGTGYEPDDAFAFNIAPRPDDYISQWDIDPSQAPAARRDPRQGYQYISPWDLEFETHTAGPTGLPDDVIDFRSPYGPGPTAVPDDAMNIRIPRMSYPVHTPGMLDYIPDEAYFGQGPPSAVPLAPLAYPDLPVPPGGARARYRTLEDPTQNLDLQYM